MWLLHHDNAPASNALSIRQFLDKKDITLLEQHPYSLDLDPCDSFLFLKPMEVSKGTRLENVEAIKRIVTTELRNILEESFQQYIETLKRRKGEGFEGEIM